MLQHNRRVNNIVNIIKLIAVMLSPQPRALRRWIQTRNESFLTQRNKD
jgi:hypothetical protein